MKKKKQTQVIISVDQNALDIQLSSDYAGNWVIKQGVENFNQGKILGKNMITFLEQLQILVTTPVHFGTSNTTK